MFDSDTAERHAFAMVTTRRFAALDRQRARRVVLGRLSESRMWEIHKSRFDCGGVFASKSIRPGI
jgi:hypothetical protein